MTWIRIGAGIDYELSGKDKAPTRNSGNAGDWRCPDSEPTRLGWAQFGGHAVGDTHSFGNPSALVGIDEHGCNGPAEEPRLERLALVAERTMRSTTGR